MSIYYGVIIGVFIAQGFLIATRLRRIAEALEKLARRPPC
jgi:hypothetical protein